MNIPFEHWVKGLLTLPAARDGAAQRSSAFGNHVVG
jgi:hypothetical protein